MEDWRSRPCWTNTWRRRRVGLHQDDPGAILLEAFRNQRSFIPTGALAEWMRTLGWDGSEVRQVDIPGWMDAWRAEQRQREAVALRPWQRGPAASRPALGDQYRVGRQLYRKLCPMSGVRDQQGVWHDDPNEVEEILWCSRQEI